MENTNKRSTTPVAYEDWNEGTQFCWQCKEFFCFCASSIKAHEDRENRWKNMRKTDEKDLVCYEVMPNS